MKAIVGEFTMTDGARVSVNMDRVGYFHASNDQTIIVMREGVRLWVRESYDAVAEILNPERQAGC